MGGFTEIKRSNFKILKIRNILQTRLFQLSFYVKALLVNRIFKK